MGWVVNAPTRPLYPHERTGTHFIGDSVDPRAVWTGAENLATTGIRSPNRPDRGHVTYLHSSNPLYCMYMFDMSIKPSTITYHDLYRTVAIHGGN